VVEEFAGDPDDPPVFCPEDEVGLTAKSPNAKAGRMTAFQRESRRDGTRVLRRSAAWF
jgi:hypothetical protein